MSIRLEDFTKIDEKYRIVSEKVISVLGCNYLNSNHYGHTLLFNQHISEKTSEERIKDIYNKYKKLCTDLTKVFNENGFELDENYLKGPDMMSGKICLLNVPLNVDKGIKHLMPAIDEYFTLHNKVKNLINKYHISGRQYFSISHNRERYGDGDEDLRSYYYLYGQKIYAFTEDNVIEEIIKNFSIINNKVNNLLKKYKYNELNILEPYVKHNCGADVHECPEKYIYILFNQYISINTKDSIIEEIIKNYIELSNRVYKHLKNCNYQINEHSNILLPSRSSCCYGLYPKKNLYLLFSVLVHFNTTDEEIIDIINMAQQLDDNIKYISNKLNLTNFYIEYKEEIYIESTFRGRIISLKSTKEKIVDALIDCCCSDGQFFFEGKKMVLVHKNVFALWLIANKNILKNIIGEDKWENCDEDCLFPSEWQDETKSSIKIYTDWIEIVMLLEGINSWTELTGNLYNIIKKYSDKGEMKNIGNAKRCHIINALQLFKKYLEEQRHFDIIDC